MDALIIFPKFYDMNTFNTIIHHIGIPKEIVEALHKLDERFILIRNSAPQYFFLGTSLVKTNNYNTILRLAYGEEEGGYGQENEETEVKNIIDLLKGINNGGTTSNHCEPCEYEED
jgi:hypothetical protein